MELAEEFLDRYRRGQRPSLKEYIDRHPELAGEIREVFPAMAMMENIAISDVSPDGDRTGEAPARDAPPLDRLGDYRIIREVGRGGMGVVYEAEQVSLGRHVALKILPLQFLRDAKTRRRFEREAKAAAKVHHTNIVPVFGVGEHDGTPYYVMQFIQGLGLDSVIDELRRMRAEDAIAKGSRPEPEGNEGRSSRHDLAAAVAARSLLTGRFESRPAEDNEGEAGAHQPTASETLPATLAEPDTPLSPPRGGLPAESSPLSGSSVSLLGIDASNGRSARSKKPTYAQSVARIGVQVADALRYAHSQGIVHRDIKPSNLLLDPRGTVWVTDFGLAKAEDQENLTHTGDILGTLRYMPPEAFEGKADQRGDVYSLGLTLYELLAFRPAFGERERGRLIHQVTTEEAPRLRSLNPEIPRDLETIVHKAIERDPAQRYPSAGELAADLQRFLNDEPIRARQLSTTERLVRWSRRHKAVAGLLVILAVVMIGGLVGMTMLWLRAERSAEAARDNERRASFLATSETLERKHAQEQTKVATERAEALAWEDYVNRVNRAIIEVERDNITQAEDLLHGCSPERRGWEWHYVKRRCHSERLNLEAGGASVNSIAFSPDGSRIATISSSPILGAMVGTNLQRRVELWDRKTGRQEYKLEGQDPAGYSVAFSPDGSRIAIGGWQPQVEVRNAKDGGVLWTKSDQRDQFGVMSLAFTPDGNSLAVAYGFYSGDTVSPVKVYEAVTGRETFSFQGPKGGNNDLAIHPDGRRLAVAGEGLVEVWDLASRKKVQRLPGHAKWVYALAYSPDGKWLASGSWDGTIKLRDAATGEERLTLFGHDGFVMDVAFSPDSRALASTSEDRSVRLWEIPSGRPLGTFHGHTDFTVSVAFSPDGRELASGAIDGTLRLWDRRTSLPVVFTEHKGWVGRLAFRRDGRRVLSQETIYGGGTDSTFKIWDPATGQADSPPGAIDRQGLKSDYPSMFDPMVPNQNTPIAKSPDGTRLARVFRSADGSRPDLTGRGRSQTYSNSAVEILETSSGRTVSTLVGHSADVVWIAFSPDGRRLATASFDRTVKLWDVATGREVFTLRGHGAGVVCLAFSPDGHRLVSGGIDFTARVWDGTPLDEHVLARQEALYREKQRGLGLATGSEAARRWAETLDQLGQRDRAVAAMARAIEQAPENLALYPQYARMIQKVGDAEGLRRLAEAAHARFASRTDHDSMGHLAEVFTLAGRRDWASAAWSRAIDQLPEDLDQHWKYAMTFLSSGNREGLRHLAVRVHERFASRTDPDSSRRLSMIFSEADRHDWAAEACSRAIERAPDDVDLYSEYARSLKSAGDAEALRRLADAAHKRFASRPDVPILRQLGFLFTLAGRYDRAAAAWSRAVALRPDDFDLQFSLASVLISAEDFERFRQVAGTIAEWSVESLGPWQVWNHALIVGLAGRWDRAAEELHRFIERTQQYTVAQTVAQFDYILALSKAGDRDGARRVAAEALYRVEDQTNPYALDQGLQGATMLSDAEPELLLRIAERIHDALPEPRNLSGLEFLGVALYRAGRFEESIARLSQSMELRSGKGSPADWAFLGSPADWAFLAMAHHCLGHRDEAKKWLEKLRSFKFDFADGLNWSYVVIGLLREEAEALILYDPIFPADPFAP
jgi:WD40 repeat protein/serine/threonine protein kinase/tetratricopeptide (TPR) repeat protein